MEKKFVVISISDDGVVQVESEEYNTPEATVGEFERAKKDYAEINEGHFVYVIEVWK